MPRRETAGQDGMQLRAEFAVELFGLELGVDGFRLVLARRWALSIGANAAQARDHSFKRAFQLLAIANQALMFGPFDFQLRAADVERAVQGETKGFQRLYGNRDSSDASPEMVSCGLATAEASWRSLA